MRLQSFVIPAVCALMLPSVAAGEHTLVVRATDASGNTGASRAVFEVP